MKFIRLRALFPEGKSVILHVMRIAIFLFFTATFGFSPFKGLPQNAKVKIDDDKTLTVDEVFEIIEEQTPYHFIYRSDMFLNFSRINIKKGETSVEKLLNKSFVGKSVSYSLNEHNMIVLSDNIVTYFEIQDNMLRGTVTDNNGVPLPSVNITIVGTSKGTTSDFDGNFEIEVETGQKLKFSSIGFEDQVIEVEDEAKELQVQMEIGSTLDEVVITGYQDIDKELFTGATQNIKGEDIQLGGTPDVASLLQGQAAGVSVQNISGAFGASPRITIRGASSIMGDTRPLWIIDGAVQEGITEVSVDDLASGDASTLLSSEVAGLNASDIESIEILKDASATAQYGARALNGVVVITTKSGKRESRTSINYSGEYNFRVKPNYGQFDKLNSQEDLSIFRELEEKGYLSIAKTLQDRYGGLYNLMYNKIDSYGPDTGEFGLINTPEEKAKFLQQYEFNNTDWFDVLFRSVPTQTHTLSISGGGKNSTSYASFSYYHDPGTTVGDRVNRLTGNIKNSYFFFDDKIKTTFQLNTSFRDQISPGTFDSRSTSVYGEVSRDFDINPFNYALNTSRALRPYDENGNYEYLRYNWAPFNILEELDKNKMNINVNDIKFMANLEAEILPGLDYKFQGTARYASSKNEHRINDDANAARAYRAADNTIIQNSNIFLFDDPSRPNEHPIVVMPYGGILNKIDNEISTYTFRNSLEYGLSFDNHNFKLYAGQEYRQTDRQQNFSKGYGMQFEKGNTPFLDPRIIESQNLSGDDYYGLSETKTRGVTFFTNLTYDFDRKYILNLVGNYEGSNRAGKSSSARWLPTFNVGGRYNLHREAFMEDVSWLNYFAVRASYGLVGIISDAASNNLPIFINSITDRRDSNTRENVIRIQDLQNQDLTYEKTLEANVGVDLGLFDDRIHLNTNAYYRKGNDLIDRIRTSGIGGQFNKLGNNANMMTKGIEFELRTQNIVSPDFNWETSLNLSSYKQEITHLENKPNVLNLVRNAGGAVLGHERSSLWSFDFAKLNEDGLPLFNLGEGVDSFTGIDFQRTEDLDKYLKYEGPIEPKVTGGINNKFRYKNFHFEFFITFSQGNVIRLNQEFSGSYNDLDVFSEAFLDRWLVPGDEERTNVPAIVSSQTKNLYGSSEVSRAYNAYNYSTERTADGSFVRMRNIKLSYNFPRSVIEKLKMSRLALTAQATNPFLIYSDSKLNGQDPEFIASGGVATPVPKQYTLTLSVGF